MAYDDIARVQEMNFTISTWERLSKFCSDFSKTFFVISLQRGFMF